MENFNKYRTNDWDEGPIFVICDLVEDIIDYIEYLRSETENDITVISPFQP